MSSIPGYGSPSAPRPPRPPRPAPPQRPKALFPTLVVVVAIIVALTIFVELWTDRLWFQSVGYASVFNTVLLTRLLMFVAFGALLALVVVGNIWLAYRLRPPTFPTSLEQQSLERYRDAVHPMRRSVLVAVGVVLAVFGGSRGAGNWQTVLLWRNSEPFGEKDLFFERDIGFFVFGYPFYRMLLNYGFTIIVLSLLAVLVTNYLYGGVRLQGVGQRFSSAAQGHLSVLLGIFVLLKAAAYWLDRYGLATSDGRLFTGISYTDENALLPAKNILMIIALICAALFFANVVRRTWMLPTIGLGLLILSAVLLGGIWPAIVQQLQVRPSEPDKEAPYIEKNIVATRLAYDVDDVRVTEYDATTNVGPEQLRQDAENLPGTRLLDPSLVSPAFDQLQQVRGFYSVPDVLDVDRYEVDGESRDMVVALREVDLAGLPAAQRNWNNDHTVYTHGYGMVAAYGNERTADGEPVWAESDLPPRGVLGPYEPRVYFGELTPEYSIVGAPKGTPAVELDIPDVADSGGAPQPNTYDGEGGVPVGGLFHQLLFAAKFWEPSLLLSGRVNEESSILYDRSPRIRVQKVAPWLTVDGDPYPAVVGRRLVWIVDAYTTSGDYPLSERVTLDTVTSDSLTRRQAYAAQAQEQINYMRNSVKAVVDAYDGTVTLYEWDKDDPILDAWQATFPGVVESRGKIPRNLEEHLRYPEDMFKVQREILSQYHVTDPGTFYQATDRWRVPEDPTVTSGTVSQPPYYLSVRLPGQDEPAFSLTSVYVPQNRQNIASFVAVDAEASSPDYGTIRILRLPGNTQIPGPNQMANIFNSDPDISTALLPFRQNETQALFGNLLTLPVGNGLLYVQPIYTLRSGTTGSYPVLRFVLASFGGKVGFGNTLEEALNVVLGESPTVPGDGGTTPPPTPGGTPTPPSGDVLSLLQQADAKYAEAQDALAAGDLTGYADATEEAQALVQQALSQLQGRSPTSGASPSPTASPTG